MPLPALQTPSWVPLLLGDLELQVSADYLRDAENVLWTPYPDEASVALAQWDAILPTPTLVDAIEAQARRLYFTSFSEAKQSRAVAVASSHACDELIANTPGLVACHKKDIVVGQSRRSHPQKVAIYGGRWRSGGRVQPLFPPPRSLSSIGHSLRYRDYSHGARGVRLSARYRGTSVRLYDCFQDPDVIRRLNNSGVKLDPSDLTYVVPPRTTR